MNKKWSYMIVLFIVIIFSNVTKVLATPSTERLSGLDRYETAIEISKAGWTSSNYIVLATGQDFPDALCAAPLAKKYNAPILLTQSKSLDDKVKAEILRLNPTNIFIIGGEGVISKNVEASIKAINQSISIERLYGRDRYETSVKVAQALGDVNKVVIATGKNFADALSMAPIAAVQQMPILLTSKEDLPTTVDSYVSSKNLIKVYVIGGTGVINDGIMEKLQNSQRIWGKDRYETNLQVLTSFANNLNINTTYLATGENFPDALAGAALASNTSSPILLMDSNYSNSAELSFINSKANEVLKVRILGGESVIPSNLVQDIINGNYSKTSSNSTIDNSEITNTTINASVNTYSDMYGIIKNTISQCKDTAMFTIKNNQLNDLNTISSTVSKVLEDNPDINYLDGWGIRNNGTITITYNYSYSRDKVLQMRNDVNNKVNEIVNEVIKPGMNDYQKELALHDYVVNHTNYDVQGYYSNNIQKEAHTAYGALIEGIAVCDGYAGATYQLLNKVGIECKFVVGQATASNEAVPHAWNIVNIDGKYYQLDTTWDDPVSDDGSPQITHDYFNITDSVIAKDHSWNINDYPKCYSTQYGYKN